MMPRFGLLPPVYCFNYGCVAILITLLLQCCQGINVNQVSIEDFIDLDDNPNTFVKQGIPLIEDDTGAPSSSSSGSSEYTITHNIDTNDVTIHINNNNNKNNDDVDNDSEQQQGEHTMQKGVGHISAVPSPQMPTSSSSSSFNLDSVNDVIVDDEDLLASGSGSGSGDFSLNIGDGPVDVLTTTTTNGRGGRKHSEKLGGEVIDEPKGNNEKTVDSNNDFDLMDFHNKENDKDIVLNKRAGKGDKENKNNVIIINGQIDDDTSSSSSSSSSDEVKVDDSKNKHPIDWDKYYSYEFSQDLEDYYNNETRMSVDEWEEEADAGQLDESTYNIYNIQSDGALKDKKWTKWRRVGPSTKVRVKQCGGAKGQKSSSKDKGCEGGLRVQVKTCTKEKGCGETHETTADLEGACNSICQRRNDSTPGPFSLSPNPSPTPPPTLPPTTPTATATNPNPTTTPTTSPDGCEYSLYDTKRRKYIFVRWDLSQVLTQSKVKRWCKQDNDQYLVMSTPTDVCRKYLKDLCQASQKCKSNKPPRERGDFAEGCWRGLVFADMLPIGLSNKQTIIYFICQRYSSDSAMGRVFGYKDTHFGTLYDTKIRAPVLSLHKMVQVGDETWPDSDYYIEHGLIEQKKDVMWLFSRHRKGMVTLSDLDRCDSHQTCDLGRFQALPRDYSRKSGNTAYDPTPLVWPEWMNTAPEARTATLTLTNTVPLHSSLREEWTAAVKKVRTFAIQECGIPYVSNPTFGQLGQMSSHRSNKSALYLASGATPSRDPSIKTGRDVPVPSYLWVAGCCVRKMVQPEDSHENDVMIDTDAQATSTETKISSFTFYIRNEAGAHVTPASVFRLEMLLKDFYKVSVEDPDVTLFPGQKNACSDLRSDVSGWF